MSERVKFIKYTGSWPCLCMGELTVEIEGKRVSFGKYGKNVFWTSGGNCGFYGDYEDEYVEQGPWLLMPEEVPKKWKDYAEEIIQVMNENVPQGCCGGCL